MRSFFERASEISFCYQRQFAPPNLRMALPMPMPLRVYQNIIRRARKQKYVNTVDVNFV